MVSKSLIQKLFTAWTLQWSFDYVAHLVRLCPPLAMRMVRYLRNDSCDAFSAGGDALNRILEKRYQPKAPSAGWVGILLSKPPIPYESSLLK